MSGHAAGGTGSGGGPPSAGPRSRGSHAGLAAWCLYDWANSAFPTVVETFIFAAYFARSVASNPERGTADWGYALAGAGLVVALASPILGAIADQAGRRKPWLALFTALAIVAAALLWFTRPAPEWAPWALAFFALGTVGFELATVFYNAMLPDLAPKGYMGRLSGWGWSLGYAGGLACLVTALLGFIEADPPPFGLDRGEAEHVRATTLLVAAWMAVFTLPILFLTPDRPASAIGLRRALAAGLGTLLGTLANVRRYREVARFLIARMVYTDGLNTLFAFGGIYAAGTLGMDVGEIILFGIALNVASGGGAALFAWIDDWIGPKRTIIIALAAITVLSVLVLVVESKAQFWALALPLGIFFGPAQAASRSLMARLAPAGMEAEMFGLYAFTGKATAFVGPALLGWVTIEAGSQRWGMATIPLFFVAGLALMLAVKEPPGARPPAPLSAGSGGLR
ncbi:MAG: MFS transporter [Alphaproteobacteria bacterium]